MGFDLKKNDNPPYQIINIKPNSPAQAVGLMEDDILLKINDTEVNNDTYAHTASLIGKSIKDNNGFVKFEVIQPKDKAVTLKVPKSIIKKIIFLCKSILKLVYFRN